MLLTTLLCACTLACGASGDRLEFSVAAGARLHKKLRVNHELQIERVGSSRDGGEFISDGTGGWISAAERLDFLDQYVETNAARPLKFVREYREIEAQGKATVTRGGGQKLEEKSRSTSQLAGKSVAFTWIDSDG